MRRCFFPMLCLVLTGVNDVNAIEPEPIKPVYNSQAEGEHPGTPLEAAAAMTVPEGFRVTLFAGEPDVSQPVSIATDSRGRLWVAEFYTYAGRGFDGELRDRIVILADTNHDGEHDQRTIFWDQGNRLTGVLPGVGGCWILNQGTLAWLADSNGDDQADGEPQVVLDGFDYDQVGHNIVSGLMYGPDGWIYGRHGIMATSYVGLPDSTPAQRTRLNCSIWRFHPQQQRFEVVAAGTTNPWGLDYNEVGEFFFTNNVIGHGWHVIPGAHYKRMYGADFNPHYYELIDQHADHYHWDNATTWQNSREDNGVHGKLGGGHSHCGGMIYLGDNWPDQYRGNLFMCNTHGRRVNQDIPTRTPDGYKLTHGEDMIFANQPWFRGVDLTYGPDGGVYLADWTDLGECHDNDGVHRLSGRIYKITYGKPKRKFSTDLSAATDAELVEFHLHKNDWFFRTAQQVLLSRHVAGVDLSAAIKQLKQLANNHDDPTRQLRAIWTLNVLGEWSIDDAAQMLTMTPDSFRIWGIRFLMDQANDSNQAAEHLLAAAANETAPNVLMYYAAALQTLPPKPRWQMVELLNAKTMLAQYPNIGLMIWYGLEPLVADPHYDLVKSTRILKQTQIPLIREFLARRIMHKMGEGSDPNAWPAIQAAVSEVENPAVRKQILTGAVAATKGWQQTEEPQFWPTVKQEWLATADEQTAALIRELSIVFGDGRAFDEMVAIAFDGNATPIDRVNAVNILASSRLEGTRPMLQRAITDKVLSEAAIYGLASFADPNTPKLLFNRFRYFKQSEREAALYTLTSRPDYATALLTEIQAGRLPDAELTAREARQIASFDNQELTELLEQVWGAVQTTDVQKQERQQELTTLLSPEYLATADLSAGRRLFKKTCSNCHRLFDDGADIGPNITGANRDSLDYLLENMLAPSAVVPKQYQISTVVLDSGRVLNGIVISQTERTLVLQTEKEKLNLDRAEIELVKPSPLSLMPAGQIDKFTDEQIRDLIGYLQSPRQVSLE